MVHTTHLLSKQVYYCFTNMIRGYNQRSGQTHMGHDIYGGLNPQ